MNIKEQMKIVNDMFCDIAEKLGMLTRQGVITVEDSIKIMEALNEKHYKWLYSKFTQTEINDFLYNL